MTSQLSALAAAVLLAGCQSAPKPAPSEPDPAEVDASSRPSAKFEWPVAEGWRSETIPFPLQFAPDLELQGVEELRFAPGMFKPDQPGYWSYAFAWWLDGEPVLGQAELERGLTRYFQGLTVAVAKGKPYKIDPGAFRTSLRASSGAPAKEGHNVQAFAGTADLYDAFATGKPLSLNLDVWVWDCPVSGKRVGFVLASPRATSEPIWRELEKRRDEFLCHKY